MSKSRLRKGAVLNWSPLVSSGSRSQAAASLSGTHHQRWAFTTDGDPESSMVQDSVLPVQGRVDCCIDVLFARVLFPKGLSTRRLIQERVLTKIWAGSVLSGFLL